MDALIAQIVEKTGLPEEQARMAANVAVDFIKDKLPANAQGMVDMALGGGDGGGAMGGAAGMLGGLFGKK